MVTPRATPRSTSAASTNTATTIAVAFSQVRPNAPTAGTRIRAVNAARLITPAPPNRRYSLPIFATGIGRSILPQVQDQHRQRRTGGERRGAQRPSRADVAHVVNMQINP